MKLQITHQTRYDYAPAVETAQHMAYLQPVSSRHQRPKHRNLMKHTRESRN